MRISEGCLADVKEAVDILAVAGDFTALRRAGREYVGLCPYPAHPDKTPSFGVSPEKGFFLCRGCGQGGDAIKLVMDLRGVEFAEAVEHLAEQSGVEVEYEDSPTGAGGEARLRRERERAEQKEALRALEAASADYHAYLMRSPDDEARSAREYLEGRGLTRETLEAFNVGVAPSRGSGKGFCRKAKERHDLDGRALAAAGLVRGGEDYFAGRITFPATDARGRTVGFGGRVLPGAPETYRTRDGRDVPNPKYTNSPESPLYSKGRLLYGLDLAQPAIRKGRRAVVVEGYTDVLMCHQAGVRNAVATCGTALTTEHLRALSPHADVVYLVFDPDAAGEKAVGRARAASELELDLRVLRLADDPADWLQGRSGGEFEGLLEDAPGIVESEIDRRADAVRDADPMTRQRALTDVQRLIGELSGAVLKNEYARRAAHAFRVPVEDVLSGVEASGRRIGDAERDGSSPAQGSPDKEGNPAERYLLSACFAYPMHAAPVLAGGTAVEGIEAPVMLAREDFEDGGGSLAALYRELVERAVAGRPFATADLVADEALRGQHALVATLDAEAEHAPEDVRAAVVRESYLRVAMLSRRRQRAATDDEDPAWDRLYSEERFIGRDVARAADEAAAL